MPDRLELGPRLRAIAALVPLGCRTLADIGTDHGYIPVSLLLEERLDRAIAADIRPWTTPAAPPVSTACRSGWTSAWETGWRWWSPGRRR